MNNNETISIQKLNLEIEGLKMEYAAVREEVVSQIAIKDQMVLAMYTLCITIIGLVSTFNMEQVIGLIFVVLIPFQAFINTKLFQIARCGAYIRCFIEPKIKGMYWEQIIHDADMEFNKKYRVNLKKFEITRNLGKYGASIFSFVAITIYIYNMIITKIGVCFQKSSIVLLFLYVALGIIVFYLNRKGTNFEKIYALYTEILIKKI